MLGLRHSRHALVVAAALVGLAACEQNGPTDPSNLSFANIPLDPRVGLYKVCTTGASATFNWVERDATNTTIISQSSSPVSVAANTCVTIVGPWYGPGPHYITVTEASHQSGFHLTSIVDTLINDGGPPGPTSTTTFTGTNTVVGNIGPDAGRASVFIYEADDTGGEGCSPGFWKTHLSAWPISTSLDFDATFGVNLFNPNITLLQAVGAKGGGNNALARAAVSAYLNSLVLTNPLYTPAQVIAYVQAGNKTALDAANADDAGLNCPID